MQQKARYVAHQVMDMVPGRFEVQPATELTHPYVDWRSYHAVRGEAEALGFRHVADVDVVSVRADPSIMRQPVLAIFIGPDDTEILGHYRLPLRWTPKGLIARMLGGRGGFLDVETHFGHDVETIELETSTADATSAWDTPDFTRRETRPRNTSLEALVRRHRERVREYLELHPDSRPRVAGSIEEIVDANRLMERRKREWRRARGWITRDELARVSRLQGAALDRFLEVQRAAAHADGA